MDFLAGLVATIIVSVIDPVMWIGPIIGAVVSRKWWPAVALGVLGGVADFMIVKSLRPVPMPEDATGAAIVAKVVTGAVYGFVVIGIAALIRRRKAAASRK